MHATEFLKSPGKHQTGPAVVLYGPQRHLRQLAFAAVRGLVLGDGEDDDAGLTRLEGRDLEFRTVADELRTVSMWGERRLVAVEDADEFVTKYRSALEKYLETPAKKSLLLLTVKSWTASTRLAKKVAAIGLPLECSDLKGAALTRWLTETGREVYGKQLVPQAAALLVELAGTGLGLLDQELAKLAAYVGDRKRIAAEDVAAVVGGWKTRTTWDMLDSLQEGNLSVALDCLHKLCVAGEAPQMILGGIIFRFRQLAQATELSRQGAPLPAALNQAGVFPFKVQASERYLRRIGRSRAEQFYELLLSTDQNIKGAGRLPDRLELERLLLHLSGRLRD